MSANPYQATNSVPAGKTDWAANLITFSIYASVFSVALVGTFVWGALIFSVVRLLIQHRSIVDHFSHFHPFTIPLIFGPFPLAFGIHKKSRLCAIVPALSYPLFMIWAVRFVGVRLEWEWSLAIPVVFIIIGLMGLAGTILHRRRKKKVEV